MEIRRSERAQSIVVFSLILPVVALLFIIILDYAVTTSRMMEVVAAADLAAHAGAQEIELRPDGTIYSSGRGPGIATSYWAMQAPRYARLSSVTCGRYMGRPACIATVNFPSGGYIRPEEMITIRAVGYMANGVTRGDQ